MFARMKAPLNDGRPASTSPVLSLTNPRLYAIALLASIVPLWLVHYLPMVDLPGHAAVITALRELAAGNSMFTEDFESNWFMPYLLGYGLLYTLSSFMPMAVAAKLIVSVAIVLTPILTGALLREVGADERWKWLAIPGSYSFAFYWGFLSFVVAIPVGLILMIQTVRFDRRPTFRAGLLVASLALFAFFSHILVMGFVCMCALTYIAGSRYRDLKGLVLRFLPYTAPLPLIAVWFSVTSQSVEDAQDSSVTYGPLVLRLFYLYGQPSGLEHTSGFVVVMGLSILLLPVLCGSRVASRPARWLPLVVGLLAFFIVPAVAFRTAFLYERLGAFLVPLWLMAWDPPAAKPRLSLDWVAIVVVAVWVATNTWRFAVFSTETRHFDAILDVMEPGKRTASMVVDDSSPMFWTPVYLHFPSWYQATKQGIVDFNFADFQMVVRRTNSHTPRIVESLAWRPTLFDWDSHGGSSYEYFLIRAESDIAALIFKDKHASVALVARSGGWRLYRNLEAE